MIITATLLSACGDKGGTDAGESETTAATPATEPTDGATTEASATTPTGTSETDATDTDASGTDTDATDTGGAGDADFVALSACEPVACPMWFEAFAESEPYTMAPERICVFDGLRDGVVGRYTYVADHEFGNGHNTTTTVFVVGADRTVTFAQHHDTQIEDEGSTEEFTAAMKCTLVAPDVFAACPMASPFDLTCYWLADPFSSGTPWWTDCAPAAPTCG